jgi:ABC-type phosphate transport system substrate-binding protein
MKAHTAARFQPKRSTPRPQRIRVKHTEELFNVKIKYFSAILLGAFAATAGVSMANAQKLTGAGATFPNPIYSRWFSEYSASHPGVQINYQSVGSGAGIRQVSTKTVDFGASDGPMTDQQLAESKIKLFHIPTVLGAVVPVYNVPGESKELRFAPDVIADIYLGKITKWNDGRIAKDNPGANLPDHQILPISSFTWLLIPIKSDDPAKGKVLHDFLEWMLDKGESEAASMTYAPLPAPVIARVRETIKQIH